MSRVISRRSISHLRAGDVVVVRDLAAILATLDKSGRLDGLPFMPEMAAFCGRNFVVSARADTSCFDGSLRRMSGAVYLEDLRCDGSDHGGCQRRCLLIWKEAWLQRISATVSPASSPVAVEFSQRYSSMRDGRGGVRYVCQLTELPRATSPLTRFDLLHYIRDLMSASIRCRDLWLALRNAGLRVTWEWHRRYRRAQSSIPAAPLSPAAPGELVRVKSAGEILATLDSDGKLRGLEFAAEMLNYCGRSHHVIGNVERLIDENTGELKTLKHECLMLDHVTCHGGTKLCSRRHYMYWREAWLHRCGTANMPVDTVVGMQSLTKDVAWG